MPELPEVETVRRRLLTCLPGLLVREVIVNDATVSEQSEAELRALLAGRRVVGLRRRGKYLIVDLSAVEDTRAGAPGLGAGPTTAVIHLRMTGQLLFSPGSADRPPRFVWRLEQQTDLALQDVRRFGRLWAFDPAAEDEFFAGMGPEPFSDAFSVAYLRRALEGRSAPLKSFLLDQRRIAGVGNIYADEALFRAQRVQPRAAGSVGPREARRLHAALLETLQAGIDHEGSSIESFIDPAGQRGSFQDILSVYQRTGQQCRVCGTTVRRTVVGGRGWQRAYGPPPAFERAAAGRRRARTQAAPPGGGRSAAAGRPRG